MKYDAYKVVSIIGKTTHSAENPLINQDNVKQNYTNVSRVQTCISHSMGHMRKKLSAGFWTFASSYRAWFIRQNLVTVFYLIDSTLYEL